MRLSIKASAAAALIFAAPALGDGLPTCMTGDPIGEVCVIRNSGLISNAPLVRDLHERLSACENRIEESACKIPKKLLCEQLYKNAYDRWNVIHDPDMRPQITRELVCQGKVAGAVGRNTGHSMTQLEIQTMKRDCLRENDNE